MKTVTGKPRYIMVMKKRPPDVPVLHVTVGEPDMGRPTLVEIKSAPNLDTEGRLLMALGDKWDLLVSNGWSASGAIFDATKNNGEGLLAVKGVGPATVSKIVEVANGA